ncbi:MAG: hypothetical protein IT361_07520 [Gemmatimonadaceae bacterium]|nr:hypothetical protein [Gemmatimonadaceae bacterium]
MSLSIVPPAISREYLVIPDFWFALVAALEPALDERVTQWRIGQRMPRATREQNAMFAAGLSPKEPATPAIVQQLAEEDAQHEEQWNILCRQVAEFLQLPPDERFRRTSEPPAT